MLLKLEILVAFAIMIMAVNSEAGGSKPKPLCGTQGDFCGRGPNRKECCTGFYCNIAPDDSYAYCDEEVTCGTQGEFCGRGPNRKECCDGFNCNIAPDDSYAYCDAEATCGTQGEFCGRGPTRKGCCANCECNIAPDDSYAYCDCTKTKGPCQSQFLAKLFAILMRFREIFYELIGKKNE